jgi:4-amino-4-deoxy-L-arabinose transferase-like glycosyltransferase
MTTTQQHDSGETMILAERHGVTKLRKHAFVAIPVGLALRLLLLLQSPIAPDDGKMYLQLARNWADHHIYGLWLDGHLLPSDLRMPGYPAFLAAVGMLLGRFALAISLSQVVVDLCTCFLTALLAITLAPVFARYRVAVAAIWLAATCPFVANYAATILTEVPVTLLATAALICFAQGLRRNSTTFRVGRRTFCFTAQSLTAAGGLLTGVATLMRPEMPLLLAVAAVMYVLRWGRRLGLRHLVLSGSAVAGAFLLPLMPWAIRNYVTLHEVQILSPRYVTLPGEYAPVGYYAWTSTWLERYRDVYMNTWALSESRMNVDDLPASAFDSSSERNRVAALFEQYNESPGLDISPEMDRQFAELARERTRRNPIRSYIRVPFQRALTIWFTPRTELLPVDGKLWPIAAYWNDSPGGWLTTAFIGILGYLYVAMALAGIWIAWRARNLVQPDSGQAGNFWGIALVLAYLVLRTAFLTTVEAPEPRYVVSCYPAVIALAALLWTRKPNAVNTQEE